MNQFLQGNFGPVHDEVTVTDLRVEGTIPEPLEGRLLRNGPNPFGPQDPDAYHWFTGEGMVHGVRLRGGKAEWYRNRWVRGAGLCAEMGEPPPPGPDGPSAGFSPNTNVVGFNGRTFALVEAGNYPVELSYELDTIATNNFDGTLSGAYTAHPKLDPATGELHAMTYFWGWGNEVRYVVIGPDARVIKEIPIAVGGPVMLHDLGLSEKYAVVFDLPCLFNVEAAMAGARLPYRWDAGYSPRMGLLPRHGESVDVIWCDVEPCFVYHPMNTYDLPDGRVVMDAVKHPRTFDRNVLGPDEGKPIMCRWTFDPATAHATEEVIDERGQEFPRHDERLVGKRNRYGYAAHIGQHFGYGGLLKHDFETGVVVEKSLGDGVGSQEAVFVPRTPTSGEDDGWLLAYTHDPSRNAANVVILDAEDFSAPPLATIHLPVRVPFGFHGNWVPD